MSNSALKISPALIVAITAALVMTQPAFGDSEHRLVLTENSSASLAVTYDGSPVTVTPISPDNWSFSLPADFFSFGQPAWIEPDNSSVVNWVDFSSNTVASVHSDMSPLFFFSTHPDGTPVEVGTIFLGGVPVFATFHDHGDTAAVPDTGTTGFLCGLSLL